MDASRRLSASSAVSASAAPRRSSLFILLDGGVSGPRPPHRHNSQSAASISPALSSTTAPASTAPLSPAPAPAVAPQPAPTVGIAASFAVILNPSPDASYAPRTRPKQRSAPYSASLSSMPAPAHPTFPHPADRSSQSGFSSPLATHAPKPTSLDASPDTTQAPEEHETDHETEPEPASDDYLAKELDQELDQVGAEPRSLPDASPVASAPHPPSSSDAQGSARKRARPTTPSPAQTSGSTRAAEAKKAKHQMPAPPPRSPSPSFAWPAPSRSDRPYRPTKRVSEPSLDLSLGLSAKAVALMKRDARAHNVLRQRAVGTHDGSPQPLGPLEGPAGSDLNAVAGHYNARRDQGEQQRQTSPILPLRHLNNWIKSVVIQLFGSTALAEAANKGVRGTVLELGAGKGGDLHKWGNVRPTPDEVVLCDIAASSVADAERRYLTSALAPQPGPSGRIEPRRGQFRAQFRAFDCFGEPIEDNLPLNGDGFSVTSLQFCLHYGWSSETAARQMMHNAARPLRPGGVLIATLPDPDVIRDRLGAATGTQVGLSFGNQRYSVTFPSAFEGKDFGESYMFYLEDAVTNVVEYVVPWDAMVRIAEQVGLQPRWRRPFSDLVNEYRKHPDFAMQFQRQVRPSRGPTPIRTDLWVAATLYQAVAFEKA